MQALRPAAVRGQCRPPRCSVAARHAAALAPCSWSPQRRRKRACRFAPRAHAAQLPPPSGRGDATPRLPPHLLPWAPLAAAAGALAAGPAALSALPSAVDTRVLAASLAAVAKLAAVCVAVRKLTRAGRLPPGLPGALSALSFQLLLPCFLASRVAATLAGAPPGSGLLALPLLASAQVALGGALGGAAWSLLDGSAAAALRAALRRDAWHPARRPARSAAAVATALALATGAPALAAAVAPPPSADASRSLPRHGSDAWRLVVASSAFGNSVTLPLLFLTQLLPPPESARAAGLCALFMVGWSPLLWSVGWRLLAPPGCDEAPAAGVGGGGGGGSVPAAFVLRARPPLLLPHPLLTWHGRVVAALRVGARRLAGAADVARGASAAALNPPLVGVLLGVAVGATPLGAYLLPPGALDAASAAAAAAAARPAPPLELGLFVAAGRCAMDAASLLGDAALPIGTLVLATALAPAPAANSRDSGNSGGNASGAAPPPTLPTLPTAGDASAALLRGGVRGEVVAAAVRLLLLPLACLGFGALAAREGLLPQDPVLRLVLLAQSCMPSAQNLVLLLALRRGTAAAAPPVAAALLRQYVLAALPVAAWMSLFVRLLF